VAGLLKEEEGLQRGGREVGRERDYFWLREEANC
jgi:hypothetical protein